MANRPDDSLRKRREILKTIAGTAAFGLLSSTVSPNTLNKKNLSVGIVGAGIVGASIAYHMAQAGANVTVFEKNRPAGGCTQNSYAWINAVWRDPVYMDLRLRSLLEYRQLDKLLGLNITWGGSLHWAARNDPEAIDKLDELYNEIKRLGDVPYSPQRLNASQCSYLASDCDVKFGVGNYFGLDGHLDPVKVTQRFLDHATLLGARIIYPSNVRRLTYKYGQFTGVATDEEEYKLDRIIIAGGVDTPLLSSQVGYTPPLQHAPGILAHSKPLSLLTQPVKIIRGSDVGFKQFPDGRLVAWDSMNPPNTAVHDAIREGYAEFPEPIRLMHGHRILGKVTRELSPDTKLEIDNVTLGFRPKPVDGFPIVGYIPKSSEVYIAVMHSGVTLAPIMGKYITQEILDGTVVGRLSPYRPDRFSL